MKTSQVVERMEVQPESLFYYEHHTRYQFAKNYIQSGPTLDIACGSGYGVNLLGQCSGVHVVGADLYRPALCNARKEYTDNHLSFAVTNGLFLPFHNSSFQNIVTLETIEHITDDQAYLCEIARVLCFDGVCILSTPNRAYSIRHNISNPYHVREYTKEELLSLLQKYFTGVDIFCQGFSTNYHDQVQAYAASIQINKKKLSPASQFVIDHIFRPIKQFVPTRTINFFIRRLLGLTYPKPDLTDITISNEPLEDTSVFIAVCRKG